MADKRITHKSNGKQFCAWSSDNGDGSTYWCISEGDFSCTYVFATVGVRVERKRRVDFTGQRQYKVVNKATVELEYRLAYKCNLTMEKWDIYGGEVNAVRKVIDFLAADALPTHLYLEADNQARAAGVSEHDRFNASMVSDNMKAARTLVRLIESASVEV